MTSLRALFEVLTRQGKYCELYTDRGSHFCQITNYDDANDYLQDVFIPKYNRRLAVKPKVEGSAFAALPHIDLQLLLSVQHARVVRNDFCVSFEGKCLQLPPSVPATLAGRKVVVHTFRSLSDREAAAMRF